MPYYITDEAADCSGWAVVDSAGEVFGCHETKDSAIAQAVAISLGDDEPFMGERNEAGEPIVISDLDDTLIRGNSLIRKTYNYLQSLDAALFIVTGRSVDDEADTKQTLDDLGVSYARLIMNPGSSEDQTEYKRATAEKLLETYNIIEVDENNYDAPAA